MVKGVKRGKQAKKGPPKSLVVEAFDLDFISLVDLKKYVAKLQQELALMRRDGAFYNINKENIMLFLTTMREVYADHKEATIVNNSSLDNLIEQMGRFSEKYNENLVISDREQFQMCQEKVFQDSVARSSRLAEHQAEMFSLRKQIADKNHRSEFSRFVHDMDMMGARESIKDWQEDADVKYSEKLEENLKEGVNHVLAANQKFAGEKLRMLASIWSIPGLSDDKRESYVSEVKRMEVFFWNISQNNNKVVEALRNKLASLEVENKKMNFSLEEVKSQNARLRANQRTRIHPGGAARRISSDAGILQSEKKLEKLKYRNAILQEHLRVTRNDFQHLKKQMIAAVRKIHLEAEFKARVIEELIKKHVQMETLEQEEESEIFLGTTPEQTESGEDEVNVFSLTIENADTLFVPPVYHESWESNIKNFFRKK